ncbi:MAG: YlxM family DNA-binding protein [Veillonellales bacterium]
MLDKILRMGLLFDFYSALLTDKQQQCIKMHYLNDYSLAEIADDFHVSRQAVYDILRRAEQTLEEYEQKLRLVERYQREQLIIRKIYDLLAGIPEDSRQHSAINQALEQLVKLLDSPREV